MSVSHFEQYANEVMRLRYSQVIQGRKETWEQICRRVVQCVVREQVKSGKLKIPKDVINEIEYAAINRKLIFGGRQLANAGREYHQTDNCFLMKLENTREGWAKYAHDLTLMFMSGGGVGCSFDETSPYGTPLKRSGGIASGPIPAIQLGNAIAAAARQGGERRGAFYASLKWNHQDIEEFMKLKNERELAHTNISVRFDREWLQENTSNVFLETLRYACQYGDPGFQFDNDDNILRNACTEIISNTPYDSCCLASLNLTKIASLQELSDVTQLGIIFLLCATEYTHNPCPQVKEIKIKNRRLGLGLMGVGEWFIQRNLPYGYVPQIPHDKTYFNDIENWMLTYKAASDYAADKWSEGFNMARPVATRAIAPTGTISIVGGHTTPGIEPVFHVAYERTYNTLKSQEYQDGYRKEVVVDPVIIKLIKEGYNAEDVDTAYTLSQTVEGIDRRIKFQAFMQRYVDNGISSTVNLPKYKEGIEDKIAPILLWYLPSLRGITFYPDGARGNQPVKPLELKDALSKQYSLQEDLGCKAGMCGI